MHLSRSWIIAAIVCISPIAAIVAEAAEDQPKVVDEHLRTEGAIWAVEEHWSQAEATGDTAFLSQFLLADYRSITADGRTHLRDSIIAGAAKRRVTSAGLEELRAYRDSHPTRKTVVMVGDMAIVTFHDANQDMTHDVRSSDVLVYRGGSWHAVYSQHTDLSK